jgi:hypothetical protein
MSSAKTPPKGRGIRFRLTAWFVGIFGSVLVAFSILLYSAFVQTHEAEFDADLFNHAIDVSDAVDFDLFGRLRIQGDLLATGGKIFPFALGRAYLMIREAGGPVVARSRTLGEQELPFDSLDSERLGRHGVSFRDIDARNLPRFSRERVPGYRMLSYLIERPPATRLILQIAVPTTILERQRARLAGFFFLAIPLTLVAATFGGLYLSRRAFEPVAAIIEKAERIGAAHLAERVPVPAADDELRHLALTLNGLLDRLQQAFESQERFVADASHQLKTPLSILRGELDVLKSRARSPEEIAEFLESASQETEYLSRMVEDLLLLARVDAGNASLSVQDVRLDEIALEATSRLEPFARARGARLRLNLAPGSAFETRGDPELLRCMVQNLVENAIKFSLAGGTVEVEVRERGGELAVAVTDEGPGVPAEDLKRVFERFYRSGQARGRVAGVGLGLPIARRIAEAHGGRIDAENVDGRGARFVAAIKKS